MKSYNEYKELLLKSFDFELTPSEQSELQYGQENFPDLLIENNDIKQLRIILGKFDIKDFESSEKSIMSEVQSNKDRKGVLVGLNTFFPRVAAACFLLILALLLKIYLTEGELSPDTIMGISQISVDDAFYYLQ